MHEYAGCVAIFMLWSQGILDVLQREELVKQTKSVEESEAQIKQLRVVVEKLESRKSAVTLRQVLLYCCVYCMPTYKF